MGRECLARQISNHGSHPSWLLRDQSYVGPVWRTDVSVSDRSIGTPELQGVPPRVHDVSGVGTRFSVVSVHSYSSSGLSGRGKG